MVNDLLDSSKKNLEIRESLQKGIFISNVTEIPINSSDKAILLIEQGDCVKVIAETKLNEKSSRSHSIFRLSLELQKNVDGKMKTYFSQLNLIDLAGSENVSKAKTEGIRLKEGSNINKSLLALSNVIQKLSTNNKSFVNYRDSKLTRLLQPALNGNSKTTIVCTVAETVSCQSETINTLHFGSKAKNIKTNIKINEILDEKGKILIENTQLKSKIKQLEDLIVEKKESDTGVDDKIKNQNEMITALEKEISLLKRVLINNEEIGEDNLSNDNLSQNSYNVVYNNLSARKPYDNMNNRMTMLLSSGKKMTDSARKMRKDVFDTDFSMMGGSNTQQTSNSVFKRCITQSNMKPRFNQPIQNSNSKMNLMNSSFKHMENNDFDLLYSDNNCSDNNYMNLLKENDDLRKNIYELRKNYIETVQNKDNQIKTLNYNLNFTMDNCEKLIREAEENYMNLKINYDRVREDLNNKDVEIKNLSSTFRNSEATLCYYKEELNKYQNERNNDRLYKEQEAKIYDLTKNLDLLVKEQDANKTELLELRVQADKLKSEKTNLKMQVENYKSEAISYKAQCDMLKKSSDFISNEKQRCKNDIESYKTEIASFKDKNAKLKNEINQIKKQCVGKNDDKTAAYIKHLETQVSEYKENLTKIENTQIVEYQKLLDESFHKITELQTELQTQIEKNTVLEKKVSLPTLSVQNSINKTVINTTHMKMSLNVDPASDITQFSLENEDKENCLLNSNGKDFLNKKRHLPRIYQTMLNKNLVAKQDFQTPNKNNINESNKKQKLEENNFKESYFSTYEM
jgi:predicted  nucleic acid-binding Zn-ribbon protein